MLSLNPSIAQPSRALLGLDIAEVLDRASQGCWAARIG
jgi:hypothetical protein